MTWTGQNFTAGQVLTATQMNNLQNDITAQANGDSGAPKNALASMDTDSVDEAQIVASAVSQGKLKSTTGEVSTTASSELLTLAGGEYGFYPQVKTTSGSSHSMNIATGISTTTYVTHILIARETGSGEGFAQHRYIQASPPYDLGDGEIPLFIFLLVEKGTRNIVSTYVAAEAPWHHNGPTIIRPDRYANGVPYRKVRRIPAALSSWLPGVRMIRRKIRNGEPITDGDRATLRDFYEGIRDEPMVEQEVTQAIKNADMNLLPHPFVNIDTATQAVVLLDPLSPIAEKLLAYLKEEGSNFELTKLFTKRFFRIDTTPLTRNGPPGVIQLGFDWRRT